MTESCPILAEVGERFQVNPGNAVLHAIEINSNQDGYEIIARQNAIAFDAGRFFVKMRIPGGMFSHQFPERVEVGRAPDGYIHIQTSDPGEDYQGGFVTAIVQPSMPSEECLVLPGDDGYGLLSRLHMEVAALHDEVIDAIGVVASHASEPVVVKYVSERASGIGYDYDAGENFVKRESRIYLIGEKNDLTEVVLDGSFRAPFDISDDEFESMRDPMAYRSGIVATSSEQGLVSLSDDALMVFAGLHASIKRLYN